MFKWFFKKKTSPYNRQQLRFINRFTEDEKPELLKTFSELKEYDEGWVVDFTIKAEDNTISKLNIFPCYFNDVTWITKSHLYLHYFYQFGEERSSESGGWVLRVKGEKDLEKLNTFGPVTFNDERTTMERDVTYVFTSKQLALACYYDILLRKEKEEKDLKNSANALIDKQKAIENAKKYIESLKEKYI